LVAYSFDVSLRLTVAVCRQQTSSPQGLGSLKQFIGGFMRALLFLLAFCCVFAGIQAMSQTGIFLQPPLTPAQTGTQREAVATGDFNGDAKPDLAVAAGPGLTILLGNGDGSFKSGASYSIPNGTLAIAVGDFNGDSKLDLAVTSSNGAVSVLFGNGDGTFQTPVSYGTGIDPVAVAIGDFNGDGKPDLAVANNGSGSVSVFLNSGTGTFPSRKDFATPVPWSIVVGDFGNNGKLDLAVTACNDPCDIGGGPGEVSVLLGNGDGTFQAPAEYATSGVWPTSIVSADLNGDGALDLAVADGPNPAYGTTGSVSVLFGNGDGTFQPQQVYSAGLQPSSVMAGDFNGDGQLDLAVVNEQDETAEIFLNQGKGVFSQPALFYGTGGLGLAAVAGNFNADQTLDLEIVCESTSFGPPAGVYFLAGNGTGGFSQTNISYPTGQEPDSAAVANLNGDNKLDIVVANSLDSDVSVYMGNGDGTFQPRVNYSLSTFPAYVAIGDLNGDGKPDLAVALFGSQNNVVSVLLNNGDGTFSAPVNYPTAGGCSFVAIGDLTGDGNQDLMLACANQAVSILYGNGNGTFQAPVNYSVAASALVLADFNGDGKMDFAVVGGSTGSVGGPTVTVFLNNGGGNFGAGAPYQLGSCAGQCSFTSIAAADFNGDGKLDLAVGGGVHDGGPPFAVLLGNGDGTFQSPTYINYFSGPSLAVADFLGDGTPDVAFGYLYYAGLEVGHGDGTFRTVQNYPTGYDRGGSFVVAGDFNGDGKPDLAVTNGSSNTLTILLNVGVASFNLAVNPTSQTVSAGNSTSFTVKATSFNGFNSSVSLACGGQPSGSTCRAKPASVIPTASGATTTVTVTTSASTPVGTYPLTITGTSGSEQFNVRPSLTVSAAPPSFSISAPSSATPSSVTAGQSATATVTAVSTGGFTGTVTFTCTVSPAPALAPVCSLNPAQATLTSGGQATSTLTVKTTTATAALIRPTFHRSFGPIYAMVFPVFGAALVGIGFTSGRTKRKKLLGVTIWSVLFAGLIFQMACGGNSGGGTNTPGTPAGNYTVTVSGSSGSTQHTSAVTLTVQ
jgi:hypothetical protein